MWDPQTHQNAETAITSNPYLPSRSTGGALLQECNLQTGPGQWRGGRICLWLPRDSGSTRSEPRAFSDLVFLHLKFIKRDLKLGQDIKTRASTHIPGTHDTIHHLDLLIHSEHAETLRRERNPVAGPLGQPWVSIGSTVPRHNHQRYWKGSAAQAH